MSSSVVVGVWRKPENVIADAFDIKIPLGWSRTMMTDLITTARHDRQSSRFLIAQFRRPMKKLYSPLFNPQTILKMIVYIYVFPFAHHSKNFVVYREFGPFVQSSE